MFANTIRAPLAYRHHANPQSRGLLKSVRIYLYAGTNPSIDVSEAEKEIRLPKAVDGVRQRESRLRPPKCGGKLVQVAPQLRRLPRHPREHPRLVSKNLLCSSDKLLGARFLQAEQNRVRLRAIQVAEPRCVLHPLQDARIALRDCFMHGILKADSTIAIAFSPKARKHPQLDVLNATSISDNLGF